MRGFSWELPRPSAMIGVLALTLSLTFVGCADDPILGPDEGESDDSGGSYSVIKRLAPADSVRTAPPNPERF